MLPGSDQKVCCGWVGVETYFSVQLWTSWTKTVVKSLNLYESFLHPPLYKTMAIVFTKLEQMTKFLMNTHASLQLLTTAQNGRIANNMYLFWGGWDHHACPWGWQPWGWGWQPWGWGWLEQQGHLWQQWAHCWYDLNLYIYPVIIIHFSWRRGWGQPWGPWMDLWWRWGWRWSSIRRRGRGWGLRQQWGPWMDLWWWSVLKHIMHYYIMHNISSFSDV